MKYIFSNQTLRTKLTSLYLVLSLIPLITVGYITYSYTVKIVKEQAIGNMDAITEKKAKQITDYINEKINDVVAFANFSEVKDNFNRELLNSIDNKLQPNNKFREALIQYKNIYDFNNIMLISPKGKILYSIMGNKEEGSNLLTGEYAETELSNTFLNVIKYKILKLSEIQYYYFHNEFAEYILEPI